MTVNGLKKLLEGLPDEAQILIQDPFSEYAYDAVGADRCMAKLETITVDDEKWYTAFTYDQFHEIMDDDEMTVEEAAQFADGHFPSLIIYDLALEN